MSNYDLIFNTVNTIFSGLSIILIIFGWIIPYKQSQNQQNKQRHYEESIKSEQYYKNRIDEQISKLYVPLYSLSIENKMQTDILLKKLNRNYVFDKNETIDDLSETDRFLWIDFVKNHFVPNLNCMKDIINNNMHLIFEPELPSSYQRFMKYVLRLDNDLQLYLNSKDIKCNTLFVEDNYPEDFDIYINKTLGKLLQLQRNQVEDDTNRTTLIFDANININRGETVVLSENNCDIPFLLNLLTNKEIIVSSQQFVIGKDNSCNLAINDKYVSQIHLILIKEEETWYIIDFNSSNGTYLNNRKLLPNSKTMLNSGDRIEIGRSAFHFYLQRI